MREDGVALLGANGSAVRRRRTAGALPWVSPAPGCFERYVDGEPEEAPIIEIAPVLVSDLFVLRLLAWIEAR